MTGVEITQTVIGALVPTYLLNFYRNSLLQNYFRHVLKSNYHKGVLQLELGHCQKCCSGLSYQDKPRLAASQPMTRKLGRLLAKFRTAVLTKCQAHQLQRYLNSATQLKLRCPSCGFLNQTHVTTNKDKLLLKEKLLCSAFVENKIQGEPKKKKKTNKRKKDNDSGLVIPNSSFDGNRSAVHETMSTSKVEDLTFSSPGNFSTPVMNDRKKMAVFVSASVSGVSPQTPLFTNFSLQTPRFKNVSAVDQKYRIGNARTKSSNKMRKGNKHLQELLSHEKASDKNKLSLADFLSSL